MIRIWKYHPIPVPYYLKLNMWSVVLQFIVLYFVFSCVAYVPEPENMTLLKTALSLYRKFDQYADAVLIAMQLGDMNIVQQIFTTCPDP